MENKPLSPFELFDTPWFKDATGQLCADGWPAFVVPLNVEIRKAKEAYQAALNKIDKLTAENAEFARKLEKCKQQRDFWINNADLGINESAAELIKEDNAELNKIDEVLK